MIILPQGFKPRPYQEESYRAFFIEGKRFSIDIWHRRAGKSISALNQLLGAALMRVGNYLHLFPELKQAREAIWNGIDKHGNRYIDYIPKQLIKGKPNNTEMRVTLLNGSTIKLGGSDRYDSLMGSNPIGIIFDEYSLQNPFAWHYLSPILTENGGWAKFIYCVSPQTLIFTDKGIQEIGDLDKNYEYGFTEIDENIYGLGGFHKATHFYKSKKTKVLTITTHRGYELTCTRVHPIWNGKKWVKAEDYKIEDEIPIQGHQNIWGNQIGWDGFKPNTHSACKPIPFKPDEDFYYFLGLYIAEGSCSGREDKRFNCVITIGDREVHDWLRQFEFKAVTGRDNQSINSNKNLCNLLEWMGCGHGSFNKQVPKKVLMAPQWAQVAFLQGYFDGDGCATKRGYIHCDSISEKLIKTIQVMLLNFGIYSTRTPQKKLAITERATGKHLCWRLTIFGGDANQFFQKIGFRLKRKQERYSPSIASQETYNFSIQVDYEKLPKDYFVGLNLPDTKRQFRRGSIKYPTLLKLQSIRPCDYIQELLDRDFRFDSVAKIEIGESEVVDFVIPDTHSFTTNGQISHNTPRGANHGQKLYLRNIDNPDWFVQKMDITQTKDWDGKPILTEAQINERRRDGTPEELIQQEFYCSFESALAGSYYSNEIVQAYNDNRIRDFELDRNFPCYTAWDLARTRDANSIWIFQVINQQIFLYDYIEGYMNTMQFYVEQLGEFSRKNHVAFKMHFAPHDIRVTDYTSEKSRLDVAATMGFYFDVAEKLPIMDGINAVKSLFPRMVFHKTNCELGLDALKQYQRDDYGKPIHNWASHCSDALRTLAVCWYEYYAKDQTYRQITVPRVNAFY
jgi:intein/homing endonuclease